MLRNLFGQIERAGDWQKTDHRRAGVGVEGYNHYTGASMNSACSTRL